MNHIADLNVQTVISGWTSVTHKNLEPTKLKMAATHVHHSNNYTLARVTKTELQFAVVVADIYSHHIFKPLM